MLSDWVFSSLAALYSLHSCTSVLRLFKYHVQFMLISWRRVCVAHTDSIIKAIYGLMKCGRFCKSVCMLPYHHSNSMHDLSSSLSASAFFLFRFEGVYFPRLCVIYFYRYKWHMDWVQNNSKLFWKILEMFDAHKRRDKKTISVFTSWDWVRNDWIDATAKTSTVLTPLSLCWPTQKVRIVWLGR